LSRYSIACLVSFIAISAVSGCRDVSPDGVATIVAPETRAALVLPDRLPTVPELLEREGLSSPGAAAEAETWRDSWTMGGEEGADLRDGIYGSLALRLLPHLDVAGVLEIVRRNETSLAAAEVHRGTSTPEPIGKAIEEARRLHDLSREALHGGRGEEALELALRASDALRETDPGRVAALLTTRALDAVRRNRDVPSYSKEKVDRARRLAMGAEKALEDGDYPRAIRRAYYACQILGVNPG
jgi:hypothetical protein